MAALNFAPSQARTTVASTTMSWSRPYSASPATGSATRAGRCPACSTGRPASTTPMVDVTKDKTTLYASDRDVFLFLVDDMNPIEAGTLPDGSPDLFFRGFYCWNSEVGAKTLCIASFCLRAVCQNRNLWGVEDFQEISIRHSKYAANRFAHEAAPALANFADSSRAPLHRGHPMRRANASSPAVTRTEPTISGSAVSRRPRRAKIVETVLAEEGRPPESGSTTCRAASTTMRLALIPRAGERWFCTEAGARRLEALEATRWGGPRSPAVWPRNRRARFGGDVPTHGQRCSPAVDTPSQRAMISRAVPTRTTVPEGRA